MARASIAALNLYPVKSCRGVAAQACDVTPTGLALEGVRDREWMLVDGRGRFVTQRELPKLALVDTRIENGRLVMQVPGSDAFMPEARGPARDVVVWHSQVRGFDAGEAAAATLSAWIEREVRLVRFDDSRARPCNPEYVGQTGATTLYSDSYPLLVIGQASLDDLNRRLAAAGERPLPMNRFRPNIVIEGLEPFDEDYVDTLVTGDVAMKLVKPCVRCEITTTDQMTARRGIEPLRMLASYRRNDALAGVTFGMNAIVIAGAGSTLAAGDAVEATLGF